MADHQNLPAYMYEDQGPKRIVIPAVMYGLAVLGVGLRFLSRRLSGSGLKLDDWLILSAMILASSSVVFSTLLVRAGFGKHIQVAKPGPDDLKLPIGYSVCYVVIISLVKYSILLFLWRIFSVPTFKKYLYIIAVIITAWAIAGLSMALMSCIPLQAYWDHSIEGRCIDIELKYLVNCIPNTATDVGLLILPIPHLLKLHVNKSQKIGLIAVFMLGGLNVIISIFRLVSIIRIQGDQADYTWNRTPFNIWTAVELNVGIFSACLPSMGPILRAFMTGSWNTPQKPRITVIDYNALKGNRCSSKSRTMATSTVIGEFSRLHEDAIDFEFASSQDSIQIHDPPVKNEGITGYRDREAAKDC